MARLLASLAQSKICVLKFVIISCLGAALLLNVMTFCFLRWVYVLHVIQMMFINIATDTKLICGANSGSKKLLLHVYRSCIHVL
jgi:hypothetical protein